MIRALVYAAQFDEDPTRSVDRALKEVVHRKALEKQSTDYAQAIDVAVNSSEQLSDLIPESHSEEAVRRFLGELRGRL